MSESVQTNSIDLLYTIPSELTFENVLQVPHLLPPKKKKIPTELMLENVSKSQTATRCRRCIECLKSHISSAKEPFLIGLYCDKFPIEINHPMALRHPVLIVLLHILQKSSQNSRLRKSYQFSHLRHAHCRSRPYTWGGVGRHPTVWERSNMGQGEGGREGGGVTRWMMW